MERHEPATNTTRAARPLMYLALLLMGSGRGEIGGGAFGGIGCGGSGSD